MYIKYTILPKVKILNFLFKDTIMTSFEIQNFLRLCNIVYVMTEVTISHRLGLLAPKKS